MVFYTKLKTGKTAGMLLGILSLGHLGLTAQNF